MRLTCPNCGAVYEVPEEVIPEAGRDVQCSNCGDTWFQAHPNHRAPEGAGHADEDDPSEMDEIGFADDQADDADTGPGDGAPADSAPDVEIMDDDEAEPEDAGSEDAGPAQRRGLDPGIAEVLRQEAAREQRAREAEAASGLETQDELGLSEPTDERDRQAREAAERMAHLRGDAATGAKTVKARDSDEDDDYIYEGFDPLDEVDTADTHDIDPASRRNLLPDIEEISSSLKSGETRQRAAAAPELEAQEEAQGGGFVRGFSISIAIFAVLLALYIFAPSLSRSVPALTPALQTYTALADSARAQADTLGRALLRLADSLAGPALRR